ncbi:MAG: glycosyltransferase [Anaerolineaceae bacterium]
MENQLITVLMAVYNGDKFLAEAIESVLAQSYQNFEFLIVDDGSIDRTKEIICAYKDHRIRLIVNDKNIGLSSSLNKGIELSKTDLIARMDADDISLPNRLEKQVEFMDLHPEVGVLGTAVQNISSSGKLIAGPRKIICESHLIKYGMAFDCPLEHPTVMFRKKVVKLVGGYRTEFVLGEDHDLWLRLGSLTDFANLPQVLFHHRVNELSTTKVAPGLQYKNHVLLISKEIERITGKKYPPEVYEGLSSKTGYTPHQVHQMVACLEELLIAFSKREQLSPKQVNDLRYLNSYKIHRILLGTRPKILVLDQFIRLYLFNHELLLRDVRTLFAHRNQ